MGIPLGQAGLSWRTILHKRENFRAAFHRFDPVRIAAYTDADRQRLLADAGIIRNRAKVNAAITNAQAFLQVQAEFGAFDRYIWQFTDHQTLYHPPVSHWEDVRVTSPESDALSADLKRRGFSRGDPSGEIRRHYHLLRLHAEHRHGMRSSLYLLPSPTFRAGVGVRSRQP